MKLKTKSSNSNAVKAGCYVDLTKLDGRTRIARAKNAIEADLVSAVGGDPSPQQILLIQRATYKALRCFLFEQASFSGQDGADEHYLSWANSLRLDLQALGLDKQTKDVTNLSEYVSRKYA